MTVSNVSKHLRLPYLEAVQWCEQYVVDVLSAELVVSLCTGTSATADPLEVALLFLHIPLYPERSNEGWTCAIFSCPKSVLANSVTFVHGYQNQMAAIVRVVSENVFVL